MKARMFFLLREVGAALGVVLPRDVGADLVPALRREVGAALGVVLPRDLGAALVPALRREVGAAFVGVF